MKTLISFGQFDKKFLFINLGFVFGIILLIIFVLIYRGINADPKNSFNNSRLLIPLIYFFGQLLCLIPGYFIQKCFKKKEVSTNNNSDINYIYNDKLNKSFNYLGIIKLIAISILYLMEIYSIGLISGINYGKNEDDNDNNDNNDYNDINNGVLSFFYIFHLAVCKLLFKQKYYKHQYCSVLILTLIELIRFSIFVYKIYTNDKKDKNDKNENATDRFLLLLFSSIFFSLFNSIVNGYKKYLMVKYYFSIYKSCYIFGFINIPIIIIIYLIKILVLDYEDKLFDDFLSINVILYFIFSILFGYFGLMFNLINNNYLTYYLALPTSLFLFIIGILYEIYNEFNIKSILIIIFDTIEILLILVILEVIELNFCGLSDNTKKNINSRSNYETNNILNDNDDNKSDDSDDEEKKNIVQEMGNKALIDENTEN